jgi:hypothetical protein
MPFGRKKKLSDVGVPGTAVIVHEDNLDRSSDDDSILTELGMGSWSFRMALEVHVDGRAPYTVNQKVKVPAKAGGDAGPGVELPVLVDPDEPQRIQIDWDQFLADGGKEKLQAAYQRKREARSREVAEAAGVDLSDPYGEPPANASPREMLEWQREKGILDEATYQAILANNPNLE